MVTTTTLLITHKNDNDHTPSSDSPEPADPDIGSFDIRLGNRTITDDVVTTSQQPLRIEFSPKLESTPFKLQIIDNKTARSKYSTSNLTASGFDLNITEFDANPLIYTTTNHPTDDHTKNHFDIVQADNGWMCLAVSQYDSDGIGTGIQYTHSTGPDGLKFITPFDVDLPSLGVNKNKNQGRYATVSKLGSEIAIFVGSGVWNHQITTSITNDGIGATRSNITTSTHMRIYKGGYLNASITTSNGGIMLVTKRDEERDAHATIYDGATKTWWTPSNSDVIAGSKSILAGLPRLASSMGHPSLCIEPDGRPACIWPYTMYPSKDQEDADGNIIQVEDIDAAPTAYKLTYAVVLDESGKGEPWVEQKEVIGNSMYRIYAGIGSVASTVVILTNRISDSALPELTRGPPGLNLYSKYTYEQDGIESIGWKQYEISTGQEEYIPVNNPVHVSWNGVDYFVFCTDQHGIILAKPVGISDSSSGDISAWTCEYTHIAKCKGVCNQPCIPLTRTHDQLPIVYFQDDNMIKCTVCDTIDGSGTWSSQSLQYIVAANKP